MHTSSRRWLVLPAVLILGLFVAAPLAGQAASITGRVTDASTQAPLPGASVQVVTGGSAGAGAVTGSDGRYRITGVPAGTHTLRVSLIGYESQQTAVVVDGGETHIDLALRSAARALDPVVVTASRRAERAQEAPASVSVVSSREIENRPAVTPADHVRTAPGVDVAQTGIHNANVVVRGFNAAFTNSLAYLVDYRIASVPALQVNRFGSLPLSNDDIDRIEVVLGPGAALYGPNTANGVLHVMSKSALAEPGSVASLSGGERESFLGTFRTAQRLRHNLGLKVSGQYFRAQDWPFTDTTEVRLQGEAETTLANFRSARLAAGWTEQQIQDSIARDPRLLSLTRIGVRPERASRFGIDGRLDWHPVPGLSTVFQAGRSLNRSIDLTGIGASVQDFAVDYYQARASYGRLFGQVYMSQNDAGDTYTLRSGEITIDNSRLWVGQLQHGFSLGGNRQNFTYGADLIHTDPNSGGTIYGRNEDSAETTQTGIYLQSETRLLPTLNLVAAGRLDRHSVIEGEVFSPRVGLVFTPIDGQTLRATYNRAFQAPTAVNLFLDRLSSRSGPFAVRAIGPGAHGFNFHLPDGRLAIRSPWNPAAQGGMDTRLGYDPAVVSRLAITFLASPALPEAVRLTPAEVGALFAANPNFTVIGRNPQTGQLAVPFDPATVQDLPGMKHEISEVFEVGYRGLLGQRFLLTADVWHLQRRNFISQLFAPAPMLLVPGEQVRQFLVANGIGEARAAIFAGALQTTPIGLVSAEENDIYTGEVPILISYKNYAEVDLTGVDIGAQALLGPWRIAASASILSDDYFTFGPTEQPIALNSPKRKGSLALGYDNLTNGVNGELRARYTSEFPVYTGVYVGNRCVEGEAGLGDCVQAATILDLTLGYRVPRIRGTSLHLHVSNLFDNRHQAFLGVPEIGRHAVLRLRQEF